MRPVRTSPGGKGGGALAILRAESQKFPQSIWGIGERLASN